MCGFYPFFLSLLSPLFPTFSCMDLGVILTLFIHSFIHSLNISYATFFPLHYSPAPNIVSFPVVWMNVCVHWPLRFGLWSHVWLVTPSPRPLPPSSFFAEGAYALGAWSGYSSAGGGDWGEGLYAPAAFRIALAIWGQHFALELDWHAACQLVPYETLNLSSCVYYQKKKNNNNNVVAPLLVYHWQGSSVWWWCFIVIFLQSMSTGPLKLDYKTLAALPTTSLQRVNRVSLGLWRFQYWTSSLIKFLWTAASQCNRFYTPFTCIHDYFQV